MKRIFAIFVAFIALSGGMALAQEPAHASTSGCSTRHDDSFSQAYYYTDGAYVRNGLAWVVQPFCDGIYVGHTDHCGTFRIIRVSPLPKAIGSWHDSCWTPILIAAVGAGHTIQNGYLAQVQETANPPDVEQNWTDWTN